MYASCLKCIYWTPLGSNSSIWVTSKVLANHQLSELCLARWCSSYCMIHSCSSAEQKLVHSYSPSCQIKLPIYHERTKRTIYHERTTRTISFDLRFNSIPSHPAEKQYHFRLPGAYHMARWVAKVIHILHEVFMIRNELKLIAIERRTLCEFCIFAAHI